MARKSRKNLPGKGVPLPKIYRMGGYVRLSSDDRRKKGDSIATQKQLIQDYANTHHDIHFHRFYIDNAKTGTSFDRPALKEMLADVENGVIDCIIVKDFSRFGRNAVDAGYYIEKYFPKLGIRFIALNDDYDSLNGDGGIMLSLKQVVNEAYALDIGRKCRAVQQQYMLEGKFVGRIAPYGYLKSPEDFHKLVVDEEAKPVVQQIFAWAKEGAPAGEIVRRLNEAGIPTPSIDRQQRGILEDNTQTGQYWQRTIVNDILRSRMYIGDMVQGKSRTVSHKQKRTKPEDWVIVENTHEAIIEKVDFYKVQGILKKAKEDVLASRNAKVPFTPSIFKGKVFCGHCGYSMHRHRQNKDGIYWFRCQSQVKYTNAACVQVSVKENDLLLGTATMLRKYAEVLLGKQVKLCRRAMHEVDNAEVFEQQRRQIQQEAENNRRHLKSLFERLALGEIDQRQFASLKQEYTAKVEELAERALSLEAGPKQVQKMVRDCHTLADCMEAARCQYDVTAELLDKYIEKILVWHDKSFEVVWRFSDPFEIQEDLQWAM